MDENKKPRICKILGVEPLEEWRIKNDPDNALYRFNGNAREEFRCGQWQPRQLEEVLLRLIENPDLIQHMPRWTKDDVEDAKAVLRLWPDIVVIERDRSENQILTFYRSSHPWFAMKSEAFPSLKSGENVNISEILEAEE